MVYEARFFIINFLMIAIILLQNVPNHSYVAKEDRGHQVNNLSGPD
jgi:hypothetical protein